MEAGEVMEQQRVVTDTKDPNWGQIITDTKSPDWGKPAASAETPRTGSGQTQPPSSAFLLSSNDRTTDAGIGAAKNITQHAINLARFVNGLSGGKFGALVPDEVKQSIRELEPHLQATSPAQKVGQVTEDVAEMVAPMGATTRAGNAAAATVRSGLSNAPRTARVAGAVARAGVDAATAGATAAVQGNDPTTAAVTGGVFSLGAQALTKAAPELAKRVENVLVKPTTRDLADGFTPSNVFKYKLGGSLGNTLTKGHDLLNDLTGKLQNVLRNSPADIDLVDVLNNTATKLKQNAVKTFGSNEAIDRAVDDFFNEVAQVAPGSGKANMVDANKIKQAVGEFGAWLHDPSGKTVDAAVRAKEIVANAYYDELKNAIENSASNTGMVKLLNKQLSDVIPVVNAVVRRIPIEQRNNIINLGDMAGIGSGHWGLMMANRALRSGQAANALSKTPQNVSPIAAQFAGQAAAAATTPKGGG